jgi:hypothetical protein
MIRNEQKLKKKLKFLIQRINYKRILSGFRTEPRIF